jgi:fatty acid desaturase 2 (delta-6 desaturase)
MFKVQAWFFVALFAHIFALHILAWWVLWYFGNNWITWTVSACLVTTSQAQAGWLQHDFGHHTVFNSTKLNHYFHDISIGLMKVSWCDLFSQQGGMLVCVTYSSQGVSSFWWNYRHFQHHAKPNVVRKGQLRFECHS